MKKRMISLLLCLVMIACLLPATAFASNNTITIPLNHSGELTATSGRGWMFTSFTSTLTILDGYTLAGFTNGEGEEWALNENIIVNTEAHTTITGGCFLGGVNNSGLITGGVFCERMTNLKVNADFVGTISGGIFAAGVDNTGVINGGRFAQTPSGNGSFGGNARVVGINTLVAEPPNGLALLNHTDGELRLLLKFCSKGIAGEAYQVTADGGLTDKGLVGLYLNEEPVKDSDGKYYIDPAFRAGLYNDYYEFTMPNSYSYVKSVFYKPVSDITGVPATVAKNAALTLSGTVAPTDATYKDIVWSIKDARYTGGTVTNGVFRATHAGMAVVTATVAYGKTSSTAYTKDFNIAVTETISVSPDALDFGSVPLYYTQPPAAQTVTVRNTGTADTELLNVMLFNGHLSPFELSVSTLNPIPAGGESSFTVRPKTGLDHGVYTESLTVAGDNTLPKTVTVTFTVNQLPVSVVGVADFVQRNAISDLVFRIGDGVPDFNSASFASATLNGQPLDLGSMGRPGADGSVADGSIILTINKAKLNSLGVGTHTLVVALQGAFAGKTVSSTVTVREPSAPDGRANPSTGVRRG